MNHFRTLEENGKKYAIVPMDVYEAMMEDVEMALDMVAVRESIAKNEEFFPAALFDRIDDNGESPISVFREYRGLTAAQLGEKIGKSGPYITMIENGRREGTISTLKAIANALNVDLELLV